MTVLTLYRWRPVSLRSRFILINAHQWTTTLEKLSVRSARFTACCRQVGYTHRSKDKWYEQVHECRDLNTCVIIGGILMFLTGQAEVHSVCRRLRKAFPYRPNREHTGTHTSHTHTALLCLTKKNHSIEESLTMHK